jgi:hypothetical protein
MESAVTKNAVYAEAKRILVDAIVAALHSGTTTYAHTAVQFGVSITTVNRIAKSHGITRPRGIRPKTAQVEE